MVFFHVSGRHINMRSMCSPDKAYALRYAVRHACNGDDAELLKEMLLDFTMWESIYRAKGAYLGGPSWEGRLFRACGNSLQIGMCAEKATLCNKSVRSSGFGPSVVRDVARLHAYVPSQAAAVAKDVFRWLQANGGYLVEHPG